MVGVIPAAILALEGLILLSLWLILYQVVKQQGRILLRLDEMEQRRPAAEGGRTDGARDEPPPAVEGRYKIGTLLPPFSLPDLNGKVTSLEEFRGRRVLVVNWSPQCVFCEMMAADLAKLEGELRRRQVEVLLVSFGDAEANRKLAQEYGLECPILVRQNPEEVEAFLYAGTPMAYLVDELGQVASPMAAGPDGVMALAREALGGRFGQRKPLSGARPLGESRIERDGLKAGTTAPTFSLPDIHGRTVSLEDYRDRQVLLVFSDPHCGPCDELAPQLVDLHRRHRDNGLAVIMVGRGDVEENRRKALAHGFDFPVVVQRKWELSKQYGIFATPVAFLIGDDGVLVSDVVKGSAEIMALAGQGSVIKKEDEYEQVAR